MNIFVDVGNTRLKWIAVETDFIVNRGHLLHHGKAPQTWGSRLWSAQRPPERVLIANVAGAEAACALTDWIIQNWALDSEFVHAEANNYGIVNGYREPEKLGVDRWVAMIGARQVSERNCVIVDCGTAVTMDALAATGAHQGGIIVPGLRLMHEALFRKTSQIPEQEMGDIVVLGRDTQECVWGGIVHTLAAAIDRVTKRMADTMNGATCLLLTGGNAELLLPFLENDYYLQPDLIFKGLRVIADAANR